MADSWKTFPFEFRGGLITNLPPLQQGIQLPGSARVLRNFEPSISGGYKRIEGFEKYDTAKVNPYGVCRVQGSGQSGTTLVLAGVYSLPFAGNTLTISGVTGTYTIATSGVSYNSATKVATLTLTTSLASSPADKAIVTFTTGSGLINGVASWRGSVLASRGGCIYKSTSVGWSLISVPTYGTALVNGGSQTGTSLIVDGLTSTPQVGDTFSIAGVEKVYTITSDVTVTSGSATFTISPSLASSPADNAAITFLATDRTSASKNRFSKYRLGTVEKIVGVDSTNAPFIYDNSTFTELTSAPAEVLGAEHAIFFKNQLFFAKGEILSFTSPYTDTDFNPANGSGIINIGTGITGLTVFREQLIIFGQKKILQLTGNTVSDFVLKPITEDIGCVDTDTIQEVGSDIMFLGPDGLRLLSGTDRFGDYGVGSVSKVIQNEVLSFVNASTSFASVVLREKSQYRIFGYKESITTENAIGILGTQIVGDQTNQIAWAELRGIRAYVADGEYFNKIETTVFAHADGYVYKMESGNTFDGANIIAEFYTPFVPMEDPRIRKTFYKLILYTDPQGSVTTAVNLKLDFDNEDVIQPETIILSNTTATVAIYGGQLSTYGTVTYGEKLRRLFETQVIGSGFTVSLQFVSNGQDPPYALDAATLEYATYDRR